MPSKSKKQARFMAAVANNPEFARKAGVSQDVGREFAEADKSRNFAGGGVMPSYYDSKSGTPGRAVKKYQRGDKVARTRRGNLEAERRRVGAVDRDAIEEKERVEKRRPRDPTERRDKRREEERVGARARDAGDEEHRVEGELRRMNKGGKVRGSGIAIKGVRAAKMIKMS